MKAISCIGLTIALLCAGPVFAAKPTVVRQLGGACGVNDTTEYTCGSGTSCQKGYCQLRSNLSDDEHACKAMLEKNGYSQSDNLNYPAIHYGYCYLARETPGMEETLDEISNERNELYKNNSKEIQQLKKQGREAKTESEWEEYGKNQEFFVANDYLPSEENKQTAKRLSQLLDEAKSICDSHSKTCVVLP
ncbi:hypothetical protein OZ911_15680 [Pseudomonas fortuita]|jgi:hypothetical protein|uniref:Uncharacterized protein n=1 Tax=Pseudomonas fortuita TaxID=3233375 RepID=A0ACD4NZK0_9PSED|nr:MULTISPECIES: hypothetical protein [Pseudomonas]WAP61370.1 hypothetical protein OZ911_15680 [Pseudomonas putida]